MKKLVFSLAILASIFTGCSNDDEETPVVITPATGEITGNFTASKSYAFGNYTLKGMVQIPAGVTVTFAAGSTITCDKTTGENGLIVLNGGKLIAEGTASEPIVFTTVQKSSGDWAGIIMYGNAPIVNSSSQRLLRLLLN